jgi:hypothetical protein
MKDIMSISNSMPPIFWNSPTGGFDYNQDAAINNNCVDDQVKRQNDQARQPVVYKTRKWSKDDEERLDQAIAIHGQSSYAEIANHIGTKDVSAIKSHLKKGWREHEIIKLNEAIDKYGPNDFVRISYYIETRSQIAVRSYIETHENIADSIKKTYNSGFWTAEEVRKFEEGLNIYGCGNNTAIAKHIGTRSKEQVGDYFTDWKRRMIKSNKATENDLKSTKKKVWSAKEKDALVELMRTNGIDNINVISKDFKEASRDQLKRHIKYNYAYYKKRLQTPQTELVQREQAQPQQLEQAQHLNKRRKLSVKQVQPHEEAPILNQHLQQQPLQPPPPDYPRQHGGSAIFRQHLPQQSIPGLPKQPQLQPQLSLQPLQPPPPDYPRQHGGSAIFRQHLPQQSIPGLPRQPQLQPQLSLQPLQQLQPFQLPFQPQQQLQQQQSQLQTTNVIATNPTVAATSSTAEKWAPLDPNVPEAIDLFFDRFDEDVAADRWPSLDPDVPAKAIDLTFGRFDVDEAADGRPSLDPDVPAETIDLIFDRFDEDEAAVHNTFNFL